MIQRQPDFRTTTERSANRVGGGPRGHLRRSEVNSMAIFSVGQAQQKERTRTLVPDAQA